MAFSSWHLKIVLDHLVHQPHILKYAVWIGVVIRSWVEPRSSLSLTWLCHPCLWVVMSSAVVALWLIERPHQHTEPASNCHRSPHLLSRRNHLHLAHNIRYPWLQRGPFQAQNTEYEADEERAEPTLFVMNISWMLLLLAMNIACYFSPIDILNKLRGTFTQTHEESTALELNGPLTEQPSDTCVSNPNDSEPNRNALS